MNLPMPAAIRQAFAQASNSRANAFAMQSLLNDGFRVGRLRFGLRNSNCYPSPSLRSGPSQTGPLPSRTNGVKGPNRSEIRGLAVEPATIKTTKRGSSKCASRLLSSLFSRHPFPVACRTPHRAGLLAPLLAPWSPMRWMKTWSQALPLAGSLELRLVGSSWACRPAIPAIDLSAFGRVTPNQLATRANRSGGLFNFRV
jgi:hypothetical protein